MRGRQLDFTSSLYLDFRHSSAEVGSWNSFTLGAPAVVRQWPSAAALDRSLRELCGTEAALIGRSTLHSFWDLFGLFDQREWTVIADEHCYPIARWAAGRLYNPDAPMRDFRHLDAEEADHFCRQAKRGRTRPLILTDSFCCVCGGIPDFGQLCDTARRYDGMVIVDDTQGLGLFGRTPTSNIPFGYGGGGSLPFHRLENEPLVAISSLAKAFGSPTAVTLGSMELISRLRREADSRFHCSQPSTADMRSIARTLVLNERCGDKRRDMLATVIKEFPTTARRYGLEVVKSIHPTQSVYLPGGHNAAECHRRLKEHGINCLLGKGHRNESRLVFLLTCRHRPQDIRQTLQIVAELTTASSGFRNRIKHGTGGTA